MFESLSDRLHDVFKKLRGETTLSEGNIAEAMREIRIALLEADVNLEIATKFIDPVRGDCLGQDVLRTSRRSDGGQNLHDHLIELLGAARANCFAPVHRHMLADFRQRQDHHRRKTCVETAARR